MPRQNAWHFKVTCNLNTNDKSLCLRCSCNQKKKEHNNTVIPLFVKLFCQYIFTLLILKKQKHNTMIGVYKDIDFESFQTPSSLC